MPFSAIIYAISLPIPDEAPVIRAFFPIKLSAISKFSQKLNIIYSDPVKQNVIDEENHFYFQQD